MKGKLRYICLNIRNGGGLSQKKTQCLFMGIEGSLTMFIQREKTGNFALFSQREERKASDLYLKGMEGSLRDI
jgi:hypothetical protein